MDEALGQIGHSIGKFMEYARPAGIVPEQGVDISSVLRDLFERERMHTESLGDVLTANIEPNLYARISAHDLKRIVGNLIENARRYGRSPSDGRAYIALSAKQQGNIRAIEVRDKGKGIASTEIGKPA